MATQLLIYETAESVTLARHGGWSLDAGRDYSFSRKLNSVPLVTQEVMKAAADYPLVFSGTGDNVTLVAVLGMRADENLCLNDAGGWIGGYVPAFLRRYPFVFSTLDDGKRLTLCIDESCAGFNQEGRGQRLFSDDGKPTPYLGETLKFLQQYQLEFSRTQAFCKKLSDLKLLEPMQARLNLESGEKVSVSGFQVVDRARLKALSPEELAELTRSDDLERIYAHLYSMRNFAVMKERLAEPVT